MSCDVDGRNLGKTNDGVLIREKIEYCMKRLSRKVILVLANINIIFLARFINCQVLQQRQAKPVLPEHGHKSEHSLWLEPQHKFGHRARSGTRTGYRGSTRAPCPGTGANINRFSSVPAVFTFLQTVKERTPNLSPISQ